MKNKGRDKQSPEYRSPLNSMSSSIQAGVCNKRHKYNTLDYEIAAVQASSTLGKDSFNAELKNQSLNFRSIASLKQIPDWWSPAAENNTAPVADLHLLRECKRLHGGIKAAENVEVAQLFKVGHQILVDLYEDGAWGNMYIAGFQFNKSAVAMWPVRQEVLGGPAGVHHYVPCHIQIFFFKAIVDIKETKIKATTFAVRSFAWQQCQYPADSQLWPQQLRVCACGQFGSILHLAAENCFWQLSRASCLFYARLERLPVPNSASLAEVLFQLLKHLLNLSDDALLDKLHLRLAKWSAQSDFSDELMMVDEAIEVLGDMDHKVIRNEQDRVRSDREDRRDYKTNYEEYVRRIRPVPKAKAVPKGKAKAKAKGAVVPAAAPVGGPLPDVIEHADAKVFLPLGAFVWRGFSNMSWQGHFPR
eukprot:TRINITY_DN72522_c0_g1_i1.p1 TRINITY_DN72522_c0_g1~~TRINITY_DN72522_c0_g1_i1.p1  ORF type:complete len:417 (-),score=95.33 TRINITY_DN72522_c0_g1_i1:108-1358(-)